MRRYIWLLFAILCPLSAYSLDVKRLYVGNITNQTHTLFRNVAQYQFKERDEDGLLQVAKAAFAVVEELNPRIVSFLGREQKVFTANCSIFFNDQVEEGGCDIALAQPRELTIGVEEVFPGPILPFNYHRQIAKSHILFARGFLDFRDGKLQEFETDLFFREDTPTITASESAAPTATVDVPLTPTEDMSATPTFMRSSTLDASFTATKPQSITATEPNLISSNTLSESSSFAPTATLEISTTPTGEISVTPTSILSVTHELSVTDTTSPSATDSSSNSASASESGSETLLPIATVSDSLTSSPSFTESTTPTFSESNSRSKSLTTSVSNSDSNSLSTIPSISTSGPITDSVSQNPSPTISISQTITCSAVPANWKAITGVYEDATNQTDRYIISGGVVTDTFTNLQWEQAHNTEKMSWANASDYCATKTTGDYKCWRLPTIQELQSLVDYTINWRGAIPGINVIAFPNTPLNYFWSATSLPIAGGMPLYVSYGIDTCSASACESCYDCYSGLVYSHQWLQYVNVSSKGYVRCVYGSIIPPVTNNRYDNTSIANMVKDLVTGLMWERQANSSTMSWQNATTHCATQTTGNFSGWRLPAVKELSTLLNYNIIAGIIMNQEIFAGPATWYWSSTPTSGNPGYAWYVGFNDGYVGYYVMSYGFGVRCVCSGSNCLPIPNWSASTGIYEDATNQIGRYKVEDGVVTDTFSNLQWEQESSTERMFWANASDYCTSRTTGDLTGWRVPTVMELQSLVDYRGIVPGINVTAFPNTPLDYFWSSTPMAEGTPQESWYVSFGRDSCTAGVRGGSNGCYSGLVSSQKWIDFYAVLPDGYIRCVRGNSTITNRYDDTSTPGVVKDKLTDLWWEKISGTGNWYDLQSYCSGKTTGGINKWRPPTIKELLTLVDHKVPPGSSTMDIVFSGEPKYWYWSSSASPSSGSAWGAYFNRGSVHGYNKNGAVSVRCVMLGSDSPPTANWKALTGIYKDATNQTGRYKAENGIVIDNFSNLQWEQAHSTERMSWADASDYCANSTTGGLTGWRLPAAQELQSLVDYTIPYQGTAPGINVTVFPNTPLDYFWSSTPMANGTAEESWYVGYGKDSCTGGVSCAPPCTGCGCSACYTCYSGMVYSRKWACCHSVPDTGYIRCVRSSVTPSAFDRYSVSTDGVVKDRLTDLEWERDAKNDGRTWQQAKEYCEVLNYAGYYSWRLPNVKELSTLLDYKVEPCGGNLIINGTFTGPVHWYWSSTPVIGRPSFYWIANFGSSMVYSGDAGDGKVRCVCDSCSTVTPSVSLTQSRPLPNWLATSGMYADATNQPGRYTSANGVVTDTLTNLQWEQENSNSSIASSSASSYCGAQTTGGYDDWRLPTLRELQSLVDYTIPYKGAAPGINTELFPDTPTSKFWSATPVAGSPGYSWYISHGKDAYYNGLICTHVWPGCDDVSNTGYVRCVRGTNPIITNRYDNMTTPGVVKDHLTGLEWERNAIDSYNWTDAILHCANQTTGGYNDWRLSTVKELFTLTNHQIAPGMLVMDSVFAGEEANGYWSSSLTSERPEYPLIVYFGSGSSGYFGDTRSPHLVRCVRPWVLPPNWLAVTGVYRDETNQTDRYRADDGVVIDKFSNLQWEQANSTNTMYLGDASAYCVAQTTGGFDDWRLPTAKELQSLVDYTIPWKGDIPGINTEAFPNTPKSKFWSSSRIGFSENARFISYGKDSCYSGAMAGSAWTNCSSDTGSVRCVRTNTLPYLTRYDAGTSGVVKDKLTGLWWEKTSGSFRDWNNASIYCDTLDLGSKTNWRLPRIKELSTLLDHSVAPGGLAMDNTAFAGEINSWDWSSSHVFGTPSNSWGVGFSNGVVYTYNIAGDHGVRCVNRPPVLTSNWLATSGMYADATNQADRYTVANDVVTDTFTNLQWEQAHSSSTMSWPDAAHYCATQTTGGFDDWQLPTVLELQSLVDYTITYNGATPGINTVAFPSTPTNYFWSSEPVVGYLGKYWYTSYGENACYSGLVYANMADQGWNDCGDTGYVRCVRSSTLPSIDNRYNTDTTGVVVDKLTGLWWQKQIDGTSRNWTDAIIYCDSLNLGGMSNWNLPTVKELSILLDYNTTQGSLFVNSVFLEESPTWFWSESAPSSFTHAWLIHFYGGVVGLFGKSNNYGIRCVRRPPGITSNWTASSGVYADATNQTDRYTVANDVVIDTFTNLQWEQANSTSKMSWLDAVQYCASRNTGDYYDWRLPIVQELQSLVDYTIDWKGTVPGINVTAFPNTPLNYFWSLVPVAGSSGHAWYVSYGKDACYSGLVCSQVPGWCPCVSSNVGYVRCVRGSIIPPVTNNRYDNISITNVVKDLVTGLMWERYASTGMPWQNAITYCTTQTTGGFSGWRLPAVKELITLVNYNITEGNLMMNQEIFAGETVEKWYWSSTPVSGSSSDAWLIGFNYGGVDDTPINYNGFARCIRP